MGRATLGGIQRGMGVWGEGLKKRSELWGAILGARGGLWVAERFSEETARARKKNTHGFGTIPRGE